LSAAGSPCVDAADAVFASRARATKLLALDFDGVMTDNAVYVFEDGREAVKCSRLEGYGLRRLVAAGAQVVIVSTEANPVVAARARKLNVACVQNIEDKPAALDALRLRHGLAWSELGFLGNDINDLGALERVGLPVIVSDAHESLAGRGYFQTRRAGGHGAVRELCDAIACVRERAP
jgi:3-deoxy-D-manno-octulosonate 8-phosphate phosphatase (KDO 8-P phosphatase)